MSDAKSPSVDKMKTKPSASKSKEKTAKRKAQPKDGEKQERRVKRNYEQLSSFIYKILKQVHPDVGISRNSMAIMNNIVSGLFEKIAREAGELAKRNKRETIQSREIYTAVQIVLLPSSELAKHARLEADKAVTRWNSAQAEKKSD